MFLSSLVKLGAHGFDALPRYAIGLAILRANEAPFLQAQKYVEGAVRQDMTIACETCYSVYLAVITPFVVDGPTTGAFVQNTLFVL